MLFSVALSTAIHLTSAGTTTTISVQAKQTVNVTCSKSASERIVWDKVDGATIAIDGRIQAGISEEKYSVLTENSRQVLTIKDISATDNGVYRCAVLFKDDHDVTTVSVLGESDEL